MVCAMELEWFVVSVTKNIIYAEIAMGQNAGKIVFLLRILMSLGNDEGHPFKFKRK